MSTPTVTIEQSPAGNVYARDTSSGTVIASGSVITMRRCSCNPSALAQLIRDVQLRGYVIDWDESTVAKPNN